jgi:MFS transporter, PPP family, 3-phenylpropionic acid transporter
MTAFLGLFGFAAIFWAHDFMTMFMVMAALSLFTSSTLPLSESLVLAHLASTNGHYSKIRLWGSWGFIVASVLLGYLTDWFGIRSLLWFILLVQCLLFGLTWKLPEAHVPPHANDSFSVWKILKQPAVISLLVGCAMMVTAHGLMYNFYSIYLAEHGYSKGMIGWLWALGVICEIGIFMKMPWIMSRFKLKTILVASLLIGVIRFSMMGLVPDHLALLLLAQTMHAFTFGSFHAAAVEVVTQYFTGRHQAKGQAIYNSVAYGIGGALGGLLGGFSLQYLGGQLTFTLAALFPLLGAIIVALGLRLSQPYARSGMFSH